MRSAEAARNTSDLIENTIKAVRNGNELTQLTQAAFQENMSISGKIGQLIDEIATASQEQSHGIGQINTAVAQMDKNVQQAAASAEESASASEEMKAQARKIKVFVDDLAQVTGSAIAAKMHREAAPAPVVERNVRTRPAMPKQKTVAGRKALPAPKAKSTSPKKLKPEQIIPFDEKEFKNF